MPSLQPAVFFDRDNTLIHNIPYLGDPRQVYIFPEAPAALHHLQQTGYLLFIISNQSGVGRGLITQNQVAAVNAQMIHQLGKPFFKEIYNCYEDPTNPATLPPHGQSERKPSPSYILQAAQKYHLDLNRSFFIGDRLCDIQCGKKAGCRSILLQTHTPPAETSLAQAQAHFVANNLWEAIQWICQQSSLPLPALPHQNKEDNTIKK